MRTWLPFFFTTRFGFGFRDCSRSRAPRIFFPVPDYSHFRKGNGEDRERKKKREKKKERRKKEKIHLVASRKLDLLELFIGNIIYIEWNVFFAHFFRLLANRIDRISVHNDKILPGNVCSARSYCFRQFFNNNYASKRLNNGTQDFCFFSKHLRSFFFFFSRWKRSMMFAQPGIRDISVIPPECCFSRKLFHPCFLSPSVP